MRRLLIFVFVFVVILFFYNNITDDFDIDDILVNDYFAKNLTWDTEFSDVVSFRKDDLINYYFILNIESDKIYSLNFDDSLIKEDFMFNNFDLTYQNLSANNYLFFLSWTKASSWRLKLWDLADFWNYTKSDWWLSFDSISYYENYYQTWSSLEDSDFEEWEEFSDEDTVELSLENEESSNDEKDDIWYEWSDFDLQLSETSINISENSLIEIKWYGASQVSLVWIWDKFFDIQEDDWNYFFLIPSGTFSSWTYFSFFMDDSENIVWDELSLEFYWKEWEISISRFIPNTINLDNDSLIIVQWKWFDDVVSIQLSNNEIFETADFEIISDTTLALNLPSGLNKDEYYLNIMWLDRIYELDYISFEVVD